MNYHQSWKPLFSQYEFDIDKLYSGTVDVYPKREHLFRVFEMDVNDISVVLLGQDPYHNTGQAHGLSFSVPENQKIPPSLLNIYKELKIEFPERNYNFNHGNLEKWFYNEHIFLLNASLSVLKNQAGSQMHIWEEFTNDVIQFISENNQDCIFVLLGNFAKSKEKFIINRTDKNKIIKGTHPSPLSAYNGFFNSGIFKEIETLLGRTIDWSV
jgi:uracil-DNA glycosylase